MPSNVIGLEPGAKINGKVPTWHMSYYNCTDCDDKIPCYQTVFELADGTSTPYILITADELLWRRAEWVAPRGIVLTELVKSITPPCSKGKHLYWRWRFMTDEELAVLGPPEEA